jgi:hypothetical protein
MLDGRFAPKKEEIDILLQALKQYIHGESILENEHVSVEISVENKSSSSLFKKTNYVVSIMVVFKTTEIMFLELQKAAYNYLLKIEQEKIGKVTATWFVCSEQGGIYLYEVLAVKEYRKYLTMTNRFIVINSLSGTVSFGPGHMYNHEISEKIHKLLETYRLTQKNKWLNEMFSIFDVCKQIL